MLKKSISILLLLLLSIVVLVAMSYVQQLLLAIVSAHDWVSETLKNVFSGGEAGNLIRGLIALLTIPLMIGLIPAIVFGIVKRRWFPYFMEVVWVVWLIQTSALIVLFKVQS